MSDSPWSEESAPAPKKSGMPTWAWWVGGGCLLLLVIVGVGGIFVVRIVKQAAKEWQDPEQQWPKIQKVLPFDKRPEKVEFTGSFHLFGVDFWLLNDQRGYMVMLMQMPETNAAQSREQMLDSHSSRGLFGKFGRHGQERLKLHVQGRELEALRFVQEIGGGEDKSPGTGPGATMVVDLTAEDMTRPLMLQMTRQSGGDEPFSEQAVIDFLEPFHVGSQR